MPNGKICIALKFDLIVSRRPSAEQSLIESEVSKVKPESTPSHLGITSPGRSRQSRSPSIASLVEGLGKLYIQIKSAEGLPSMDSTGDTNPFVRCYLLPSVTPSGKRKTPVVHKSLNPVWNEQFFYKRQQIEDLKTSRALEVTVWDMDRRGTHGFMGCVRLGPNPFTPGNAQEAWMDSSGEEVMHWEEALDNPEEWVERWHVLRPSSSPRVRGGKKAGVTGEAHDTGGSNEDESESSSSDENGEGVSK